MNILYPPQYVFPRNPDLSKFLDVIEVKNEKYDTGLTFDFGFTGVLNVIRTKYPIYLDKKYFNFKTNKWEKEQINITLVNGNNVEQTLIDITPYFTNSTINFSINSRGVNDTILYYFDGSKIVTNYDFSNVEDRERVSISYNKILNSIRVKAILNTNNNGISFYTPTVDQYTLMLDKQRVIS